MSNYKQMEITVYGRVQGVGFRPFVAELAEELELSGSVRNAGGIVKIQAIGTREALDEFVHRLSLLSGTGKAEVFVNGVRKGEGKAEVFVDGVRTDRIASSQRVLTSREPMSGAHVDRIDDSKKPLNAEVSMYRNRIDRIEVSEKKLTSREELPGARVDRIEVSERELTEEEQLSETSEDRMAGSNKKIDLEEMLCGADKKNDRRFQIVQSQACDDRLRFLPPDIATCDACLSELFDPKNRRYRYPFISCTACGPRFSIMEGIPYDRDTITMRAFEMCPNCRKEYLRKGDVRRHAQTIACEACGPEVRLYEEESNAPAEKGGKDDRFALNQLVGERAIRKAISLIKEGKIVAIKDIGGYHLAFDPFQEKAAQRLRQWKQRERKPFAVMFADIKGVSGYCIISETERKLLESDARPIVLLRKRKGRDFAPGVCGSSDRIGAILPCNPMQHLIIRETGPLVMTSGNRGGEPMITEDDQMLALLATGVPDAVLSHDRRIRFGLDDSIYQVTVCGNREIVQIIRRARGLVPEPVPLPGKLREDVFAAGGDLKAVFALGRENMAYLSGHFGDLDDMRAAESRRNAVSGMSSLLGISPVSAVRDCHPNYVSGIEVSEKHSEERILRAWHHHAHIAAVIGEYHLSGPVLGVAYDGTGFGEDGTVWGGEILLCEDSRCRRAGHIRSVKLMGGDSSAKNADVTACCYLNEAVESGYLTQEVAGRAMEGIMEQDRIQLIRAAWKAGVNTVTSSSMGRLFDAVAALLGICTYNSYEGECPQLLQTWAERYLEGLSKQERESDSFEEDGDVSGKWNRRMQKSVDYSPENAKITCEQESKICKTADFVNEDITKTDHGWVWDSVRMVARLAERMLRGEDVGRLAYEFHAAIAKMTVELCQHASEEQEGRIRSVALAGGTMYNGLLLSLLVPMLEEKGFAVYVNEKVPSGDGGLAYGQLYLYSRKNEASII